MCYLLIWHENISVAKNGYLIADSGSNASWKMQKYFVLFKRHIQ